MGRLQTQGQRSIETERRNAVDQAWAAEVELVRNGKGTRQWTAAEQKELLSTGHVQGYQGHHMQSVKTHPEQAGNKDNIQFLTLQEHLKAHNNDPKNNPTNGYYDPETGQMHEFKNGIIQSITPADLKEQAFESPEERENAYKQGVVERFNAEKDKELAKYQKNLEQRDDLSAQEKADRYKAMSDKYEKQKQENTNKVFENEKTETSVNKDESKATVNADNAIHQTGSSKIEALGDNAATVETAGGTGSSTVDGTVGQDGGSGSVTAETAGAVDSTSDSEADSNSGNTSGSTEESSSSSSSESSGSGSNSSGSDSGGSSNDSGGMDY